MIQRKQTLYLISLVLLSVLLLFIPSAEVSFSGHTLPVCLLPVASDLFQGSFGQIAAMILNMIGLLLTFICIFLYQKRLLQLKLTYTLMVIWLLISLITSFLPFVLNQDGLTVHNTNYGTLLGIFGMLSAYMAARLIKKDIELLKSADRIR